MAQRVLTFLEGRAALGRDLSLREQFSAEDLEALGRVLSEASPCAGSNDEGRAIAQIIHDVAPGASGQLEPFVLSRIRIDD